MLDGSMMIGRHNLAYYHILYFLFLVCISYKSGWKHLFSTLTIYDGLLVDCLTHESRLISSVFIYFITLKFLLKNLEVLNLFGLN